MWLTLPYIGICKKREHQSDSISSVFLSFFKKFYSLFIFETETEHQWGRGRERRRHRIPSRLQALSCQHRARCGTRTHKLWDRDLTWSRMLNRLSHPGAPVSLFFNVSLFICYLFIYFLIYWEREREREREREWVEEGQRQKERDTPKLTVQSPMQGSIPWTVRWLPELKSSQMLNRLSHPGTTPISYPSCLFLFSPLLS